MMQQDENRQSRFNLDPLHRGALPSLRERASSQPPGSLGDALSTRIELANRRYESAFGAPGTPPVSASSPWTPTRPSALGMSSTVPARSATTRSLSFSTSQDFPSRFHPFMPDTFASTFEDDEDEVGSSTMGGDLGQEVYDSSHIARGNRTATLLSEGLLNRSRSQSLAGTSRRQVAFNNNLLPVPGSSAFAQSWGERPSQLSNVVSSRYAAQNSGVGGLGPSGTQRGLSGTAGTDLSNMSPFVRDVNQIYLDDSGVYRDSWGLPGGLLKEDGGGSGTTSRRHSVSVVQARRPIAMGFSVPGAPNDSPTFADALAAGQSHSAFAGMSGYGGSRGLMIADDELANDLNVLSLNVEGHRGRGDAAGTRSRSSSRPPLDTTRAQSSSLPLYGLPSHHRTGLDQPSTPTGTQEYLAHLAPGSAGLPNSLRRSPAVGDPRGRLSASPSATSGRNGHVLPSPTSGSLLGQTNIAPSHEVGDAAQGNLHISMYAQAGGANILNGSQARSNGPPSPLAYSQNQNVLTGASQQRLAALSASTGGGASPTSNPIPGSSMANQYPGQSRGMGANAFNYGPKPLASPTSSVGPNAPHPGYTRSLSLGGPTAGSSGGNVSGLHVFPTTSNTGGSYGQPLSPLAGQGRVPSDQYPAGATPQPLADLGRGVPLHLIAASTPLFIVEFKAGRTDLFFCPDPALGLDVQPGDLVIVEADRGKDLGKVVNAGITGEEVERFQRHQLQLQNQLGMQGGGEGDDGAPASPAKAFTKEIMPKRIYAKASAQDIQLLEAKVQDEAKALQLCQTKVRAKKLPMEVIEAEYQWDRRKLTFYFVADRRIDFRELVRELFRLYKTRIWMACLQGPSPVESAVS